MTFDMRVTRGLSQRTAAAVNPNLRGGRYDRQSDISSSFATALTAVSVVLLSGCMTFPVYLHDEAQPLSVLLVDGNDSTLRELEVLMRSLGLRTETASSSQRALDLLAQATFDLVLLDVDLGPQSELDGLSLCQVLKRSRTRDQPGPLLVVASLQGSATDKARAAFAGCDAHLAKPLDEATLRRALRRLGLRLAGSADTGFNSRPGSLHSRHVPLER